MRDAERKGITAAIRFLENKDLVGHFLAICRKASGREFFYTSPQTLEEKEGLYSIEKAGLIVIDTAEFRWSTVSGQCKKSEAVGTLTDLGRATAKELQEWHA
jgi:hypothetical protein